MTTDAQADIHWVRRHGAEPGASTVMEVALRRFAFPGGDFFTWVGGEATTLRSMRRYLVREREVNPELASFSGHWKRGVAGHDHHEPIEN